MKMDAELRNRLRRRTTVVLAAVGLGLICGAYLLPRVADAASKRPDPLSLKKAEKSTLLAPKTSAPVAHPTFVLKAQPLVVVPEKRRFRTPHKPPPPQVHPHNPGPPPGLSFT